MKIESLIELADSALKHDPADTDVRIEKIEAYSRSLSKWQKDNLSSSGTANHADEIDPEKVKLLLSRHNELMKLIEELKSESRFELGELKKKGEAIQAYTDDRPEITSLTKPSKG